MGVSMLYYIISALCHVVTWANISINFTLALPHSNHSSPRLTASTMLFNVNRQKGNQGQADKATHASWRKKMWKNHPSHSTMTLSLFQKKTREVKKDSVVQRSKKKDWTIFFNNVPQFTYKGGPTFQMLQQQSVSSCQHWTQVDFLFVFFPFMGRYSITYRYIR